MVVITCHSNRAANPYAYFVFLETRYVALPATKMYSIGNIGSRCLYPMPRSEDDDSTKRKAGGIARKTISRRARHPPRNATAIVTPSRIRNGSVLLMRRAAGKYQCDAPK